MPPQKGNPKGEGGASQPLLYQTDVTVRATLNKKAPSALISHQEQNPSQRHPQPNFLDHFSQAPAPTRVRGPPRRSASPDLILTTSDDTNHLHDNEISTCDRRSTYTARLGRNQSFKGTTPCPSPPYLKKKLLGSQGTKNTQQKIWGWGERGSSSRCTILHSH